MTYRSAVHPSLWQRYVQLKWKLKEQLQLLKNLLDFNTLEKHGSTSKRTIGRGQSAVVCGWSKRRVSSVCRVLNEKLGGSNTFQCGLVMDRDVIACVNFCTHVAQTGGNQRIGVERS